MPLIREGSANSSCNLLTFVFPTNLTRAGKLTKLLPAKLTPFRKAIQILIFFPINLKELETHSSCMGTRQVPKATSGRTPTDNRLMDRIAEPMAKGTQDRWPMRLAKATTRKDGIRTNTTSRACRPMEATATEQANHKCHTSSRAASTKTCTTPTRLKPITLRQVMRTTSTAVAIRPRRTPRDLYNPTSITMHLASIRIKERTRRERRGPPTTIIATTTKAMIATATERRTRPSRAISMATAIRTLGMAAEEAATARGDEAERARLTYFDREDERAQFLPLNLSNFE